MDDSPQLENGYTRISNELLDAFCRHRIPGELRQIIDYIIRKTYGYQKKEDKIPGSQIVLMTGISKGNVSRGLSKLITNKIVIRNNNKLRLNKNFNEWVSFKKLSDMITNKEVIKTDNKKLSDMITEVIKTDNKKLSDMTDSKERKKILKENINIYTPIRKKYSRLEDIQENDMQEIADRYKVSLGFVKLQYEKMCNWLEASGKKKKNYKATLRNFVLGDMQRQVERRSQYGDKSATDARHLG